VNPFATVIHRVNECDERKGTTGVNARLRQANTCAHHTVFISAWLRDLHLAQGMNPRSHSVIHNGADTWTFHPRGYLPWRGQGPMRLVTHQWDPNPYKGADIYLQVDRLLADPRFRSTLDFTFIGNPPNGVTLRHATMLPPMHGQELADTIRSHHVYLTGSQNEPAGMSHIEGACCGLPLLFRKSGALPEYCADYGLGFTGPDIEQVVAAMAKTYQVWIERIRSYPFTAERMCARYMELFQKLLAQRENAANGLKAVR
jgi:glycosyltransferase involved in cell wall biosynthesis